MNKLRIYLKSLTFNNGTAIDLTKNDILVFAGPNNCGKSQSLKDIEGLLERKKTPTVISKIQSDVENEEDYFAYAKQYSIDGSSPTSLIGPNYQVTEIPHPNKQSALLVAAEFATSSVLTDRRLSTLNPSEHRRDRLLAENLVQHLFRNQEEFLTLSTEFEKAFGSPLLIEGSTSTDIDIRISNHKAITQAEVGQDADKFIAQRNSEIAKFPLLANQGDGERAFATIVAEMSLPFRSIFLIDEPEAFLHPNQAYLLGQEIGRLASDDQVFLSTHSSEIIKSLLDTYPDRVKIVKIARVKTPVGDINCPFILDNTTIQELNSNPLLKYSKLLDGLFYDTVVLCESDVDCRFYEMIEQHRQHAKAALSSVLFIPVAGKAAFGKTISSLKAINAKVKIIADIDFFDNKDIAKPIIEVMGGNWEQDFAEPFKNLSDAVSLEQKNPLTELEIVNGMKALFDSPSQVAPSNKKIEEAKAFLKPMTIWKRIKQQGINLEGKDAITIPLKTLIDEAEKIGIYVVPVGEIESFVPEFANSSHGKSWLQKVFEKYPLLDDTVYSNVKDFTKKLGL